MPDGGAAAWRPFECARCAKAVPLPCELLPSWPSSEGLSALREVIVAQKNTRLVVTWCSSSSSRWKAHPRGRPMQSPSSAPSFRTRMVDSTIMYSVSRPGYVAEAFTSVYVEVPKVATWRSKNSGLRPRRPSASSSRALLMSPKDTRLEGSFATCAPGHLSQCSGSISTSARTSLSITATSRRRARTTLRRNRRRCPVPSRVHWPDLISR
mmetsp:Transcript_92352/g.244152  ORF Transcript_92352/g.244152 Transcript_92352/m.244152 type:complete len:210 (+) Transcript_92352:327-956(+)